MNLKLFLLRHGQTALSRDNDFCGAGMDPELTRSGEQMGVAFALAYQDLLWAGIYSSPLRRAVATASPLAEAVGVPIQTDPDLSEIGYGEWEGKTLDDVRTEFHDDYLLWAADPAWNAPTRGESGVLISRRVIRAIEAIRSEVPSGNVLVVSHKATIRIALCTLLGIDVGRYRERLACPVGSVSVIEFAAQGPLVQTLADRSHLSVELREAPGT